MNDSWLDAAADCGAHDLNFLTLVHRGQLQKLLQSYQESGEEIAIIQLGEVLGNLASPSLQIDSGVLSTKTLALFLAGAFG